MYTVADKYGDLDIEDLQQDEPQELEPENGRPLNFQGLSEHRFDWDESFDSAFGDQLDLALASEEPEDVEDDIVLDTADLEELDKGYAAYLASHDLDNL